MVKVLELQFNELNCIKGKKMRWIAGIQNTDCLGHLFSLGEPYKEGVEESTSRQGCALL